MAKRQVILHCRSCNQDFVIREGKGKPVYNDGECTDCMKHGNGDYANGKRSWIPVLSK